MYVGAALQVSFFKIRFFQNMLDANIQLINRKKWYTLSVGFSDFDESRISDGEEG